jgi:hypothetical protein
MTRFLLAHRSVALALLLAAGPALAQSNGSSGGFHRHGNWACHADADRLCADVEKGGGRVLACLKEHAADLAPACQDAIKNAPKGGRREGADNPPPK